MIYSEYTNIKAFAYVVPNILQTMNRYLKQEKTTYQLMELVGNEYNTINNNDLNDKVKYKKGQTFVENMEGADHVYMITDIMTISSDKIVLDFIKNKQGLQPLQLESIITKSEFEDELFANLGTDKANMLYNFAYWPTFLTDLKRLKNEMALAENWAYNKNATDDDFPILISYIKYTFAKLWQDKQLITSYNKNYISFNTGLVNKNYQYIYAVFERNGDISRLWKFKDFCIPAVKAGGRLLAENFERLPAPARYFSSIQDISYIIDTNKTPDEQLPEFQFDHYFIDHPERLPLYFLLDGCRKDEEIVKLLKTDLTGMSDIQKKEHWKNIGNLIGDNPDVYDDLEGAFRNAVRKSVMRVSWNYRTAIPVYFPTYNKMSILLPLSFGINAKAEVALVVEKMPHMNRYIAPTILDLPKAYSNARLVCKPESDWLNQEVFDDIELDESEGEL